MPRLNISTVPRPPREYRPSRAPEGQRGERHESVAAARAEDGKRAKLIRRACRKKEVPFDLATALELAAKLERAASGERGIQSMASKVSMRGQRNRIVGSLWQLHRPRDGTALTTATTIPRGWQITPENLEDVDPRTLMDQVRASLKRAANATKATKSPRTRKERGRRNRNADRQGFAIGALHGEFNPVTGLFQLHMHFVLDRAMVPTFEALRKQRPYKARKPDPEGVYHRVRITRKRLTNLPYPLTYPFQSMWPQRWKGKVGEDEVKSDRRSRISEPYHTMILLWLDRWSLKDVTLLHGISVGKRGLACPTTNANGGGK